MGAAVPFGLALLEKLQGKEAADEMAKKIVYR
jgi:4-methyl-5(b-hydroxyethyl)-thiazole monophosphate biosynthesis